MKTVKAKLKTDLAFGDLKLSKDTEVDAMYIGSWAYAVFLRNGWWEVSADKIEVLNPPS